MSYMYVSIDTARIKFTCNGQILFTYVPIRYRLLDIFRNFYDLTSSFDKFIISVLYVPTYRGDLR